MTTADKLDRGSLKNGPKGLGKLLKLSCLLDSSVGKWCTTPPFRLQGNSLFGAQIAPNCISVVALWILGKLFFRSCYPVESMGP